MGHQSEILSPGAKPEVSVIINCYNEAGVLRETLDSIFAQTFDNWEIVFWDNASHDGSGEIAASYGERVRCFRSATMLPLGRARKSAYDQTRGNYISILDADDIWMPEKLERQLSLFRSDPRLGMAYCDAICFNERGNQYRLFKLTKPHRGDVFGQLVTKNFIFSSTMMFRREALDALGCAFDDRFSRAQDYDLSLRVAYHYPIDYVDEPLVKWRMNGLAEKPWKRSLVSRAEEVQLSLERLMETYPEIKTRCRVELESFYKNLDYSHAVTAWQNGDPAQARRHLSRHMTDKKFAFVCACTFLMSCDLFYTFRTTFRNLTMGRL